MKRYNVISEFICCGEAMVIVIMESAACAMSKEDYNRLTKMERKLEQAQDMNYVG